jgi:AcrR family transcriptional regulator
METKAPVRRSARERLLTAADELFYAEGIHTVGIDRVIEHAGVAKASLYNTFGSKDELVRSYLTARNTARQERIRSKLTRYDNPRDRLLGVFDILGELIAEPNFRGCAFLRASSEQAPGGVHNSVGEVCDNSRAWVRMLFADLATDAGASDPAVLAGQLVLLYDGATVSAQMDHDKQAGAAARSVAALLLDAATA